MFISPRTPRLLLAVPAAALAFSLAACAGGPGGSARPSADQVSDGFAKIMETSGVDASQLGDSVIACFSQHLVDSKLSDADLSVIAKGDTDATLSTDAQEIITEVYTDAATDCATTE